MSEKSFVTLMSLVIICIFVNNPRPKGHGLVTAQS